MRKNKDDFFMDIATKYAEQTTCTRRAVGAVLVKNGIQIGGGFNGAPKGIPHCTSETCIRNVKGVPSGERQELCIGAHAEANAIVQAGRNGINTDGSILYCTTYPCSYCAKLIVNAGIKRVVYGEGYADIISELILQNIQLERYKGGDNNAD